MGGKNSAPVIGYWYKLLLHLGCCWAADALRQFRGGDKVAWEGRCEGGTLAIAAENLWGGEKGEGGIVGDLEVLLGDASQMPSSYLATNLGPDQTAYRGKTTLLFKGGKWGAFNPYPKPASALLERITKDWPDEDGVWLPDWVAIGFGPTESISGSVEYDAVWKYKPVAPGVDADYSGINLDDTGWAAAPGGFDTYELAGGTFTLVEQLGQYMSIWLRRRINGLHMTSFHFDFLADSGITVYWNGVQVYFWDGVEALEHHVDITDDIRPLNTLAVNFHDIGNDGGIYIDRCYGYARYDYVGEKLALNAMNAAHILYLSCRHDAMEGKAFDMLDVHNLATPDGTTWDIAAETLYNEGFGLCTRWNPVTETVQAFQQRILSIIGASMPLSRVDGRYRLLLHRPPADVDALEVLVDDDILEYEEEPSDPLEATNQVIVEWFDPVKKEKRSTAPLQSLGAIQAAGGVIAETLSFPEIPTEELALRVAARELAQRSSPVRRFTLTTTRRTWAWNVGQFFRLQAPRRGIADMVCTVADLDVGAPGASAIRLIALQDVSGMPTTVYVDPTPSVDGDGSAPTDSPHQRLMEAPYVELAGTLRAADLAALEDDVGFILAMGTPPVSGARFTLWSGADGTTMAERGNGEWCPTAVIVESASIDPSVVDFTFTNGEQLDEVVVGQAALWGEEIVRVDAIGTGTLRLGRGCADTLPRTHASGERIYFYDADAVTDSIEYSEGETVNARLLSRTSNAVLSVEDATVLTVAMDGRMFRPYPPGQVTVNDEALPSALSGLLTVAWVHRDRLLQADTLVDAAAPGVGPEAGTTYTLRYYADDVLVATHAAVSGTSDTYTPAAAAEVRIELEAVRDSVTSWHTFTVTFDYTP